ncbi:MAG: hypothetical protein DWQ08_02930 [Proteobacteria bacterium]|nr:MAG: hypothetical protein DWQ08_02930 [Pseudomonadota bacterium]
MSPGTLDLVAGSGDAFNEALITNGDFNSDTITLIEIAANLLMRGDQDPVNSSDSARMVNFIGEVTIEAGTITVEGGLGDYDVASISAGNHPDPGIGRRRRSRRDGQLPGRLAV